MTRTWTRRLCAAGALVGGIALLWLLFGPLATLLGGAALDRLDAKDQLAAISTIRGQIGTVLSAGLVGGGLYYTGRKFFLDRDKQFTDRFNAAIDHLGSADETVRAGGVRALDRILHDSPTDRNRVLESLTGFLRKQNSTAGSADRDDITAAVAALRNRGRSSKRVVESPLVLRSIKLPQADLRDMALVKADLSGKAELTGAFLTRADLRDANLNQATLINVDLATANLSGADLRQARFTQADLSGAILDGADLRGTDLSQARGLTVEQLERALTDERTTFPPGLGDQQNPAT